MKSTSLASKSKIFLALSMCLPLTAYAANTRPVAVPDTMTLNEDTYQYFNPTPNDTDVDGDTLYLHSIASQPAHGAAGKYGHNVKYTPNKNYCGTDSFEYWVADGSPNPGRGTITVNVTCVNDVPSTTQDALSTFEDNTSWTYVNPLSNDSDVDGDPLTVSGIAVNPNNGYAVISGDNVGYKPYANFCGNDSFTYRVSDGTATNTDTVYVSVSCVSDRPTAVNDVMYVNEDSYAYFEPTTNDSDVDGDSVYLHSIASNPANGTAGKYGNSVKYTPNPNFCGQDSFDYWVGDGTPYPGRGTITVNVNCVFDNDILKGKHLMHAQVSQMTTYGTQQMKISTGYFVFDGDGNLEYKVMNIDPNGDYKNTKSSAKHVNVAIREAHCLESNSKYPSVADCLANRKHDIDQVCSMDDMGEIHHPTSNTVSGYNGTYTIESSEKFTVSFEGKTQTWEKVPFVDDESDTARWKMVAATYPAATTDNVKGFAYFSEGKGSTGMDFRQVFDQGTLKNSARGYLGKTFSNNVNGYATGPNKWLDEPASNPHYCTVLGEKNAYGTVCTWISSKDQQTLDNFKLSGVAYSNVSNDASQAPGNTFSNIWYYDTYLNNDEAMKNDGDGNANSQLYKDENGLMVHNTLNFFSSSDFPTLIYRNTGHIFPFIPANMYEGDAEGIQKKQQVLAMMQDTDFKAVFDKRHCWSKADTVRTQGHTLQYLGAMNGGVISNLLGLEISRSASSGFPVVTLSYGRWTPTGSDE